MSDEEKAQELISIFNCEKDKDIENFKTYYQLSQIQDLYERQD